MDASAQTSGKAQLGYVRDLNAEHGKTRPHEIIIQKTPNGNVVMKTYHLGSDKPQEMPIEHAMKFLVDKSFEVTDEKGVRIEPVVKREGGTGGIALAPNEVIAILDELSLDALKKRAMILPGSENLKASAKKDELIGFLMASAQEKTSVGRSRGSEGVIGEMAGVEKLFEDN